MIALRLDSAESRLGAALLLAAIAGGLFAGWLAPHDPWAPSGRPYGSPSAAHLLGTNDIGQDILSEILYGVRVSLIVGLAAAGLATLIGTSIGMMAGYFRGPIDDCLMAITDTLMLVPALPLMIVLVAYTGPSFWSIAFVIGLIWWTGTARAVRAKALQVREMPFIEAAQAMGFGNLRVLLRHLLPNVLHVAVARFITAVPEAILTEAGLSFLGLGDPSEKSLGLILNHAFLRGGLLNGLWWWYTFPVLTIAFIALGVTLLGLGTERE